jgi:hypothetical protein
MARRRWYGRLELALIAALLYVLGAAVSARLTPADRRLIELEAGLQQLYWVEQAHYASTGRYFDPTRPDDGFVWPWMRAFRWEYRSGSPGFWLTAWADLDADGKAGSWGIDARGPQVRQLMDD